MLFQLFWSEEAQNDLEDIFAYYLEVAGMDIATRVVARLNEQIEALKHFPDRARPGRVENTKEFVIEKLPYVVVIAIDAQNNSVILFNILHTAKKYPASD